MFSGKRNAEAPRRVGILPADYAVSMGSADALAMSFSFWNERVLTTDYTEYTDEDG